MLTPLWSVVAFHLLYCCIQICCLSKWPALNRISLSLSSAFVPIRGFNNAALCPLPPFEYICLVSTVGLWQRQRLSQRKARTVGKKKAYDEHITRQSKRWIETLIVREGSHKAESRSGFRRISNVICFLMRQGAICNFQSCSLCFLCIVYLRSHECTD